MNHAVADFIFIISFSIVFVLFYRITNHFFGEKKHQKKKTMERRGKERNGRVEDTLRSEPPEKGKRTRNFRA